MSPLYGYCDYRRGCYWYSDGSMYDGQWVAGKMHGKGVFVYPSGNRYFHFHVCILPGANEPIND